MDLITLGVEVQTTGAAQAAQGLGTFQKAATGAAGAADQLENKVNALNGAQGRTVAPARAMAGAVNGLGAAFNNNRSAIQNTSFQLQDIIVQMEMGVPASRVLGQQLPQLLGGFGPLGAVIGVAVGALLSFAPALFAASDPIDEVADSIKGLADAMSALRESSNQSLLSADLAKTYGAQAGAARELLLIEQKLALLNAQGAFASSSAAVAQAAGQDLAALSVSDALSNALTLNVTLSEQARLQTVLAELQAGKLLLNDEEHEQLSADLRANDERFSQLNEYRLQLRELAATFGINEGAAANLAIAISAVTSADTTEQRVTATKQLAVMIADVTNNLQTASPAGRVLYQALLDASKAGLQLEALDIASGIGAGADAAARLASNMSIALAAGAALDKVQAAERAYSTSVGGGRGLGTGGPDLDPYGFRAQLEKDAATRAAAAAAATGTRSGGGGVSAIDQDAARLYESTRTEAEKFAKELANLETLFQGGAIDGDLYARALEDLNQKFDPFTKLIEGIADSVENELNSAFAAVLDGTKSLGDALLDFASNVLAKVAQDLFAQQFSAPIADGLSGLLSGVVGGIAGGGTGTGSSGLPMPFAKGGVVSGPTIFPFANGTGLMGEAGPEAIMPLSRGADGKLGVTAANGNSAPKITINNYSGQEARASSDGMGNIMVEIGRAVAQDITSGGPTYRAIKTTFGISNRLQQRG